MDWILYLLELVQQNKALYIIVIGIVLGIVNAIVFFVQKKADKYRRGATSASAKKNHIIVTLFICFFAAAAPLIISVYYPYSEPNFTESNLNNSDTTSKPANTDINTKYNGYLKLSFFNGRFAYRTYVGQNVYNENDVIEVSDRSYFSDSITPLVYITILDNLDQIVYEGKSEHLNSCLIGMNYGAYTLIASCENYRKYTVNFILTPENKTTDIWQHDIFFVPNEHIATDLKIQISDKQGLLLNNCEVSIGYPGFALSELVDETGTFNNLFTLAKGEYLVSVDSLNLYGRFYINELTEDNSLIVVKLE